MKTEEYIKAVVKTEASDLEGIRSRLIRHSNIRLMHAGMGLASEVGELVDAGSNQDMVNVCEELGDCLWYISIGLDVLGGEFNFAANDVIGGNAWEWADRLTVEAGEILSVIKAHVFYGREIDTNELTAHFVRAGQIVSYIAHLSDTNIEKVMEKNITKLHKKRYKGGKFSEQAANNRDLAGERKILEQSI